MSYDVNITDEHGSQVEFGHCCGDNYTSNVAPMFYACIPAGHGGRYGIDGEQTEKTDGLPGLSGLPTEKAAELLGLGIIAMVERADEMRALNPKNGWGSYDGTLEWLRGLKAACEANPGHTFWVDW